ncbi:MAG: TPM domain-containing protein [Bacteroidota bacterium]|nr:TPM domain-containing protein [Bacteroidota bacterium]
MKPSDFFNENEQKQIEEAISIAEHDTSGEIRVHVESVCKGDLMDRAAYVFGLLKMQKTKLRNGVLFYLSIKDHKFAILGDIGINKKVPANFWEETKILVLSYFNEKKYAEGLSKGIIMAGEQLKSHFPYQDDDVNELSDEISFGK